ncbi:MAG: sulfotransferase [Bacteroidota bacterium]|nr:sulfotransferase [Bacteroidota bacterium]
MNKTQLAETPLFFIIGRPRSGTYLIRSLFDAHPNIIIPTECPLILNMYPKYGDTKQWSRKKLEQFTDDLYLHKELNNWTIDKEELRKYLLRFKGEASFQTLIKAVYSKHKSQNKKEDILLFGDKNPVYSTNTKKLFKIFPDAKYIHLTRDYRDNIQSILKVDFEAPYIPLIAYRWRYSAKRILKLKSKNPNSFYTIRYEDFVTKPKKHFAAICDFLNIPYTEDVFDFNKKKDSSFKNYPEKEVKKYHQSLQQPINTKKIGIWKKHLSVQQVKMAEAIIGKYAEKSGYERVYKSGKFLTKLKGFPGIIYGRSSYAFADFLDFLPYKIRIKIKHAGSILAVIYWKIKNL